MIDPGILSCCLKKAVILSNITSYPRKNIDPSSDLWPTIRKPKGWCHTSADKFKASGLLNILKHSDVVLSHWHLNAIVRYQGRLFRPIDKPCGKQEAGRLLLLLHLLKFPPQFTEARCLCAPEGVWSRNQRLEGCQWLLFPITALETNWREIKVMPGTLLQP